HQQQAPHPVVLVAQRELGEQRHMEPAAGVVDDQALPDQPVECKPDRRRTGAEFFGDGGRIDPLPRDETPGPQCAPDLRVHEGALGLERTHRKTPCLRRRTLLSRSYRHRSIRTNNAWECLFWMRWTICAAAWRRRRPVAIGSALAGAEQSGVDATELRERPDIPRQRRMLACREYPECMLGAR